MEVEKLEVSYMAIYRECRMVYPFWKTVEQFPLKLNTYIAHNPAILLLGIYLRKIKIHDLTKLVCKHSGHLYFFPHGSFFFFPLTCGMWKGLNLHHSSNQQWQCCILNPLSHEGTLRVSLFLIALKWNQYKDSTGKLAHKCWHILPINYHSARHIRCSSMSLCHWFVLLSEKSLTQNILYCRMHSRKGKTIVTERSVMFLVGERT